LRANSSFSGGAAPQTRSQGKNAVNTGREERDEIEKANSLGVGFPFLHMLILFRSFSQSRSNKICHP
jgi:hypothetical protein